MDRCHQPGTAASRRRLSAGSCAVIRAERGAVPAAVQKNQLPVHQAELLWQYARKLPVFSFSMVSNYARMLHLALSVVHIQLQDKTLAADAAQERFRMPC